MTSVDQESVRSDDSLNNVENMNNYQAGNGGTSEPNDLNDGWSRKNITVKLFVGQVPKIWQEDEVLSLFKIFGDILETQIIRDTNGNHRGCAFVKFASLTQADIAIASLNESCFLPGVICFCLF